MGGPRPTSWAPIIQLPSCFLSGLLGRMGGPRPRSWVLLGSLHVSFFWVLGRMGGPQQRSWASIAPFIFPFWALGSDGQAAAKKLGSRWAPFMFPSFWAPGSDGWATAKKLSLHISFLESWVGWVVRGQKAGLLLGSLQVSFFLGPGSDGWAAAKKLRSHYTPLIFPFCAPGSDGWAAAKKPGFRWAPFMFPSFWAPGSDGWATAKKLGRPSYFLSGLLGRMGGPRPRSWARIGLPSYCLSRLLGRMGGPVGLPSCFLLSGSWVGWVGRHWAPFIFPFWALGSDAKKLGSRWAPFMFPAFWVLGRMGGPRQRSWAPITLRAPGSDGWATARKLGSHWAPFLGSWVGWVGRFVELPSCFLLSESWVGWGGPQQRSWVGHHVSFLGSWVGWVGRGQEAGLALGSLHIAFLGSWVGWVGPLGSLHVSFFLGPGSDGWAVIGLPSYFLSGLLGRMPRSWAPVGLPSCFLLSGVLGRMGPRSWARIGLPSYCLSGLLTAAKKLGSRWAPFMFPSFRVLGRMGGPRQRSWGSLHISFLGSWVGWVVRGQKAGLLLGSLQVSFFLGPGSDGWAAAKKLGSHYTPLIFPFCAPGSDGWAAAKKPGFRWAPFMFPCFWAPGPDGWAAATKLGSHWAPFILFGLLGGWVGRGQELGSLHVSFLGCWVGWVGRGQG